MALRECARSRGCLPVFAEVTAPLLAAGELPQAPEELRGLMPAHRTALRRDLAAPTAARSNVHVRELDVGHGMVTTRSGEAADPVEAFLREHTDPDG